MHRFLHLDDFRKSQFAAGALLLAYVLQCLWLVRAQVSRFPDEGSDQTLRVHAGLVQWRGGAVAGTPAALGAEMASGIPSAGREGHLRVEDGYDLDHSPLYYLLGSAGALPASARLQASSLFPLLATAPQIIFGAMLGSSIWYVTRRLYGSAGGLIALGLYCFSPAMIIGAAGEQSLGEMGGVWGAFGSIFTAIAVAHTLYAPREVVLWNWRRILLLALSMALAVGNQFSLIFIPLAILPLMMWVAPVRRRAVLAIWGAALVVASCLLIASYRFEVGLFVEGMTRAKWFGLDPYNSESLHSYGELFRKIFLYNPALMIAFPVAFFTFLGWKRARYFGNTAPLIVAGASVFLMMGGIKFESDGLQLIAVVFLIVFSSGVLADLLETGYRTLVTAGVWGVLAISGVGNVWRLMRVL